MRPPRPTHRNLRRSSVIVWWTVLTAACTPSLPTATPARATRPLRATPEARDARAHALKASHARTLYTRAMATVRATLVGNLDLAAEAARQLRAAHDAAPAGSSSRARIARTYGRFLNLWAAEGDLSRVDEQLRVYADLAPTAVGQDTLRRDFEHHAFLQAARAAAHQRDGSSVAALARVKVLERMIRARTEEHPHEVDIHTMGGNYALAFAAFVPTGRDRRLDAAIEYLTIQQENWSSLSPGARNESMAPNVRTVFAFSLAEAAAARGRVDEARANYQALINLSDVPDTAVRRQLVDLARERMHTLPRIAGRQELLPVWPSGALSCVACHATQATLPEDRLFRPVPPASNLARR